jgi:2Fe-2S ferredoxin
VVSITYVEADGTAHTVEVKPGCSLMQGAVWNGVPGIVAECGGNCACGTCRIYVGEDWQQRLGERSELEEATLELREPPGPHERLSCQITVTEALDGLVVNLPERQF